MLSGENAAETCVREVFEETGLKVRVVRLIGVYSSPDWLVRYPDGNQVQIVAMSFETEVVDGRMTPTSEVSEFGFYSAAEVEHLDLMENHHQRLVDAFSSQKEAFIR
jgi:ADP-ribose pyrophosphatase YjhB (NUDIX family)